MTHNSSTDLLNTAERLAPLPATRDASPADWARHYTAQAFAAFTALYSEYRSINSGIGPKSRPEIGYLAALAQASMAAAIALTHTEDYASPLIWDLTPESGALNGEWEEWLTATLDGYGINPADINPAYVASHFRSPSQKENAR